MNFKLLFAAMHQLLVIKEMVEIVVELKDNRDALADRIEAYATAPIEYKTNVTTHNKK